MRYSASGSRAPPGPAGTTMLLYELGSTRLAGMRNSRTIPSGPAKNRATFGSDVAEMKGEAGLELLMAWERINSSRLLLPINSAVLEYPTSFAAF